jgi:hypothetical protein
MYIKRINADQFLAKMIGQQFIVPAWSLCEALDKCFEFLRTYYA